MDTKAIVFDAYGTLFDVNSAAEKCKDKIGDKWEGFANFWRTTQLEYTWLRSLMKRHKDFWKVTEESLDKSMKVFNIDISMKKDFPAASVAVGCSPVASPTSSWRRVAPDRPRAPWGGSAAPR